MPADALQAERQRSGPRSALITKLESVARLTQEDRSALAGARDLVAIGETAEEEDAIVDPVPFAHHVGGGVHRLLVHWKRMDRGAILGIQANTCFEPSNDPIKSLWGCHLSALRGGGGREHVESLSTGAHFEPVMILPSR